MQQSLRRGVGSTAKKIYIDFSVEKKNPVFLGNRISLVADLNLRKRSVLMSVCCLFLSEFISVFLFGCFVLLCVCVLIAM